jgi:hypothetical protein
MQNNTESAEGKIAVVQRAAEILSAAKRRLLVARSLSFSVRAARAARRAHKEDKK